MKNRNILLALISILILSVCISACTLTSNNDHDKSENDIKISQQIQTEDKSIGKDTSVLEDNNKSDDLNTDNNGSNKSSNTSNTNTGSVNNSGNSGNSGSSGNSGNAGSNDKPKEQNCHYETRTETIPAWTEQVLVKEAWTEKILVKDAWTEESNFCTAYGQDQRYIYVCHNCGHVSSDGNEANRHGSDTGHGSWYQDVEYYGDVHCLAYETEYINHPAEYSYVNHPAEYKDVYHPEETKTYQVQVCD